MSDSRNYAPIILAAGLVLIAASFVYWVITQTQSQLFVGAGISLVGMGGAQGIRVSVKRERDKLSPLIETTDED